MNLTPIKLLILDVDGVLTDGRLIGGAEGEPGKGFYVQDGSAIKRWQASGGTVALLSGRSERCVANRAEELGIKCVHLGVETKLAAYEAILKSTGHTDAETSYVGDDHPDLGPLSRCAFPVAVANATPVVKRASAYVTRRKGGDGAVAEVIEFILRRRSSGSPKRRDRT
jgi:3-deoxy-D-manno-octulosonate 8-phosphate phosphatase (KDO 8-P phosphatase)